MANSNVSFGLKPIRDNGSPWDGPLRLAYVPASQTGNLFVGDPLVALGGGDAFGVPSVGIASAGAGNTILGVMIGIANGPAGAVSFITRDLPIYRQASIANYVYIVDDPNALFTIQEDSLPLSAGFIPAATAEFRNGNLIAGAGNTTTGLSGWLLDSSTVVAGAQATAQVKVVGLTRGPDNAVGNYAKWVVRLNNPQLWSTSGVA